MSTKELFLSMSELTGIAKPDSEDHKQEREAAIEAAVSARMMVLAPFEENAEDVTAQDEIDDFDFARKSLREAVLQQQSILNIAMTEAAIAPHPRTVEVATQAATALAQMSESIVSLHGKKSRKPEVEQPKNVTNNNLVFNGSAADLLDVLKPNVESIDAIYTDVSES